MAGLVRTGSPAVCAKRPFRPERLSHRLYRRPVPLSDPVVLAGTGHVDLRLFAVLLEHLGAVSVCKRSGGFYSTLFHGAERCRAQTRPLSGSDTVAVGGAGICARIYILRISLGIVGTFPV